MKRIFLTLSFLFALFAVHAQVDSTRIEQTFTTKQKYALHFLGSMDWSQTDVINLINEIRPQYDSANSDKVISITAPSGLFADGMRQLSALPEGQASQYNEEMLDSIFPQISNLWLATRMQEIRAENWKQRDERNKATADRLRKIKPL